MILAENKVNTNAIFVCFFFLKNGQKYPKSYVDSGQIPVKMAVHLDYKC